MAKKYDTVKYETTPQVLETHGGKINVSVKGNIPAKYLVKSSGRFHASAQMGWW